MFNFWCLPVVWTAWSATPGWRGGGRCQRVSEEKREITKKVGCTARARPRLTCRTKHGRSLSKLGGKFTTSKEQRQEANPQPPHGWTRHCHCPSTARFHTLIAVSPVSPPRVTTSRRHLQWQPDILHRRGAKACDFKTATKNDRLRCGDTFQIFPGY